MSDAIRSVRHLGVCLSVLLVVVGLVGAALADPLDQLPIDASALVLRKETVTLPAGGAGLGVTGSDIVVPRKGFLGIDWAFDSRQEITLMLVTQQQKNELLQGRQPTGKPLFRFDIQGPETAGQNIPVSAGTYFIALINRQPTRPHILYRASFQAF